VVLLQAQPWPRHASSWPRRRCMVESAGAKRPELQALALARTLRQAGLRVEPGSHRCGAFAKQLKRADRKAEQLGAADRGRGIEQGVVILKDLRLSLNSASPELASGSLVAERFCDCWPPQTLLPRQRP